jgi:hypothetical protein
MTGQANSRGFNPGQQDATPALPWPHLEDNMGLAEYSTSTIRASLPPSNMRKNIFNNDVDFDLEDFSTPHLISYNHHINILLAELSDNQCISLLRPDLNSLLSRLNLTPALGMPLHHLNLNSA